MNFCGNFVAFLLTLCCRFVEILMSAEKLCLVSLEFPHFFRTIAESGLRFSKQGKWLATLQKLLVGHIPIPAKCESVLSQRRAVPALGVNATYILKKLRFTRICNFSIRLKAFQANRSLPILHEVKFPFLPMSHHGALHQRYSPQYRKSLILGSTKERLFCCSLRCFCFRRTSYCFSCSTIRCWRSIIFCEKL